MKEQFYNKSVLFLFTILSLSFSSLATAMTAGVTIPLPTCGSDPNANTKMIQAKIDLANPGDTLILPSGMCVVSTTSLTTNTFNTNLAEPHGIYLEGPGSAPQAGFITSLFVNKNSFGCGFYIGPFPTLVFPLHAFVRPSGQAHTGNIGVLIPCQ